MEVNQIVLLCLALLCAVVAGSSSTENTAFVGKFENHKYDKAGKNNYHYVTISFDSSSGNYKWTSRGNSWMLYARDSSDELKVGPDCPYYNEGHTVAKFTASGVYGPQNEFYSREYGSSLVVGNYENHGYDKGGKNDSHYVSITYDSVNNKYTWRNKAGRSWRLYSSAKANELRVGTDCPYYSKGHTIAKVTQTGIYGHWNEFYTRIVVNPWFVGYFENFEPHLYDKGDKYLHRYVTITYDEKSGKYTWTNLGNVNWTLYPTEKEDELRVGTDCPYYKSGHRVAKVTYKGILGPGNELYSRVPEPIFT